MTATSFKELMGQLKEDTTVQVAATDKKQLADHYNFTEGWYDALLNTDKAIRSNTQGPKVVLDPAEKRQIVEIGVYEGASSCFWSDFYLDHEESSLKGGTTHSLTQIKPSEATLKAQKWFLTPQKNDKS